MKKFLLFLALCNFANFSFSAVIDANKFGFLPSNDASQNAQALQKILDSGGDIEVRQAGIYDVDRAVKISSNTNLKFFGGVKLRKDANATPFTYVLINSGAYTKIWDENIKVSGLEIIVNGVDTKSEIYGLRGHLSFSYARNIVVENFKCLDLGEFQFCIQVCTFENLVIDNVEIRGKKDGVHLGRGKNFKISNSIFETFDDAIALNGHDYATSNPQLGWIENGLIENIRDLDSEKTTGFFCRILAGGWLNWSENMSVQHSDTVISQGRLYRVQMHTDGKKYISKTRPTHTSGAKVYDGINWGVAQDDETATAGVRNVKFKNISLEKPRISFAVQFDNSKYSRSYYPDAPIPVQGPLFFEEIKIKNEKIKSFLYVATPVNYIDFSNSSFKANAILFVEKTKISDYGHTQINMQNCSFNWDGDFVFFKNGAAQRKIDFYSSKSVLEGKNQSAKTEGLGAESLIISDFLVRGEK